MVRKENGQNGRKGNQENSTHTQKTYEVERKEQIEREMRQDGRVFVFVFVCVCIMRLLWGMREVAYEKRRITKGNKTEQRQNPHIKG